VETLIDGLAPPFKRNRSKMANPHIFNRAFKSGGLFGPDAWFQTL